MLLPENGGSIAMILWIFLGAVVLLLLYGIAVYNRLVRLRALVHEAFSGITVQLRRRADLIPNLVETVKGYATHERETLDAVVAHRGDAMRAGGVAATAQADNAMTAMLGRLFAVAEAYPELKADANFRDLQDELSNLEGELQSARRYYNATARDLNTRIFSFPDMVFAGPMGFKEEPYYEDADESIQSAPKVEFQRP
jgi:LemA protein